MSRSQLYRVLLKEKNENFGRFKEQFSQLWDFCEVLRNKNCGSTVMMKVERPCLAVPPTFQRLYVGLAKQGS